MSERVAGAALLLGLVIGGAAVVYSSVKGDAKKKRRGSASESDDASKGGAFSGGVTVSGGGESLGPTNVEFHRLQWLQASDGSTLQTLDELKATYAAFSGAVPADDVDACIQRDVTRTFPQQEAFQAGAEGRDKLRQLLRAYAQYDTQVGYVQGMNFIAAFLLMHVSDAEAFALMVRLFTARRFGLRALYLPGLPGVTVANKQLQLAVEAHLPRLGAHFASIEFSYGYIMEWYYTLFTYMLPVPMVADLWDSIMEHGWTAVLRVVMALLEIAEPEVTASEDGRREARDLSDTIQLLKSFRYSSGNSTEGERGRDDVGAGGGAFELIAPHDMARRVAAWESRLTHKAAAEYLRKAQASIDDALHAGDAAAGSGSGAGAGAGAGARSRGRGTGTGSGSGAGSA